MKQVTTNGLLRYENRLLARALEHQCGYYLLQVGDYLPDALKNSLIANHIFLSHDEHASLQAKPCYLPFANESIDVVILSHALDHSSEREALMWEIKRVLRHDGCMVVLGYNPWRKNKPGTRSLAAWRAQILLEHVGFSVDKVERFGFFTGRLIKSIIESMMRKIFPFLCAGYLLVAKKQTISLTPLTITARKVWLWNKKPAVSLRTRHD